MVDLDDKVDGSRMRVDRDDLLRVACRKLHKYDKHRQGLLPLPRFQAALREMSIEPSDRQFKEIMNECSLTHDGFVNIRQLLHNADVDGRSGSRKNQDSSKMRPLSPETGSDSAGQKAYSQAERAHPVYLGERVEELRRVFGRWQRFVISTAQLKAELTALGFESNSRLEHALRPVASARELTFCKFAQALQVDEVDGRKSRPITPRPRRCPSAGPASSPRAATEVSDEVGRNVSEVRRLLHEFIDGHVSGVTFRNAAERLGVVFTPELEKKISRHQLNGHTNFRTLLNLCLPPNYGLPQDTTTFMERRPYASGKGWETARATSQPPAVFEEKWRAVCEEASQRSPRRFPKLQHSMSQEIGHFHPVEKQITSYAQCSSGPITAHSTTRPGNVARPRSAYAPRNVAERPEDVGTLRYRPQKEVTSLAQGDNGHLTAHVLHHDPCPPRKTKGKLCRDLAERPYEEGFRRHRHAAEFTSRAQGHHGLIIAHPDDGLAEHGQPVNHPPSDAGFGTPAPHKHRRGIVGTRLKGGLEARSQIIDAPFAKHSDPTPSPRRPHSPKAPYGTAKDYRPARRDYRGAKSVTPREFRQQAVMV